jgi:hypothetical protein
MSTNFKNLVQEYCIKYGIGYPKYEITSFGPDHARVHESRARFLGQDFRACSQTKTGAEQAVAQDIWGYIETRMLSSQSKWQNSAHLWMSFDDNSSQLHSSSSKSARERELEEELEAQKCANEEFRNKLKEMSRIKENSTAEKSEVRFKTSSHDKCDKRPDINFKNIQKWSSLYDMKVSFYPNAQVVFEFLDKAKKEVFMEQMWHGLKSSKIFQRADATFLDRFNASAPPVEKRRVRDVGGGTLIDCIGFDSEDEEIEFAKMLSLAPPTFISKEMAKVD